MSRVGTATTKPGGVFRRPRLGGPQLHRLHPNLPRGIYLTTRRGLDYVPVVIERLLPRHRWLAGHHPPTNPIGHVLEAMARQRGADQDRPVDSYCGAAYRPSLADSDLGRLDLGQGL